VQTWSDLHEGNDQSEPVRNKYRIIAKQMEPANTTISSQEICTVEFLNVMRQIIIQPQVCLLRRMQCTQQHQEYLGNKNCDHQITKNWLPRNSSPAKGKLTFVSCRDSDMVARESETSTNDLTDTEPRVQLNAEECCDASTLNV
jgi:hypothetical protein